MLSSRVVVPVTAAVASALAGFTLGRRCSTSKLRRHLKGNQRLLTKQERRLAAALIEAGQGHLFRSWPPPGVRDGEKRALLAAAARGLGDAAAEVEPARLALLAPPEAAQRPKVLEAHGDKREDPYYWLRDDSRKDPAVLAHLRAENEHCRAVLADTEGLQESLYTEMRARMQEDDTQVPVRYKGYFYYSRNETGKQYAIRCRRRVPAAMLEAGPLESDELDTAQPEEILLDENARKASLGVSFYSVGSAQTSPDQRLYAWMEDTEGREHYTLHVKDIASGAEVSRPVPNTSGDFEWAADNATIFYVVQDALERPYKVFRHKIGSPPGSDVVVYEETDEAFYVHLSKGHSEQVLYISSGSAVTSETRMLPADTPEGEWRVVLPRVQDTEYSVYDRGDWLYLVIRDAARPNRELRVAHRDSPADSRVLIPHSRDVKIEGISLGRDWLILASRSGGLERAVPYRLPYDSKDNAAVLAPPPGQLGAGQEVAFEEPAYSLSAYLTGDWESPLLRMTYTSLTTPSTVIDMHLETGKRCVKKVAPVLGGFDKSRYVTERLWATAQDGVKVPISLVYRKGLAKLDGSDPVLLYGYGSYEISIDPWFTSSRLSLLDRGFVWAIAHVRGGGEMGRFWYEDGKFGKKANTFTDFVAAAEHLITERRIASPAKLAIEGRSAGGLLMGAVLNMRPDLFHAALIGVGFLDALTTMLDATIPLTVIERDEWGDPEADPEVYRYMKSYSPVDNVKPQAYPHILAVGGLHDPRVGYWEPAKFVAKVRQLRTDPARMLLLKTEMGAGHFSVTGRFERLKETAFETAFLLKAMGMTRTPLAAGEAAEAEAAKTAEAEGKGEEGSK